MAIRNQKRYSVMIIDMQNNHVYYQRDAKFSITPNINEIDAKKLVHHIARLKKMYVESNTHTFFWKFNVVHKSNSIIIDETAASISFDVLEQLSMIAMWIFEHGYFIKGDFTFRINKVIKYLYMDGQCKSVSSIDLFDATDITNMNDNEIMRNTRHKIDLHMGDHKSNNFATDVTNGNDDEIMRNTRHKINLHTGDHKSNNLLTYNVNIFWENDGNEYSASFSKNKHVIVSPYVIMFHGISILITLSCLIGVYVHDKN